MFTGGFFREYIILIPGLVWIITQIVKIILHTRWKHMQGWTDLFQSGGMPSSHSSFMFALSMAIGLKEGFTSSMFALSLAISGIVLYDAMHVRLESGKHGEILNDLLEEHHLKTSGFRKYFPLEISIGHTMIEAIVGSILGLLLGAMLYFI